jgi:glutamate-1-semialdehyde aminotransferase
MLLNELLTASRRYRSVFTVAQHKARRDVYPTAAHRHSILSAMAGLSHLLTVVINTLYKRLKSSTAALRDRLGKRTYKSGCSHTNGTLGKFQAHWQARLKDLYIYGLFMPDVDGTWIGGSLTA